MKVLIALKKYFKYQDLFRNPRQPKPRTMQKPTNQPAMHITDWLQQNASPKPEETSEQTRKNKDLQFHSISSKIVKISNIYSKKTI